MKTELAVVRREIARTWQPPNLIDPEETRDTETGHRLAEASLKSALAAGEIVDPADVFLAGYGAELRIWANGYVTLVFGQRCFPYPKPYEGARAGAQGLAPARIAAWRTLSEENDLPVRIVFVEHGGHLWEGVWLDRGGETAFKRVKIAVTPTLKREGWYIADIGQQAGMIEFPETAPPRDDPADAGRLL